VRLVRHTNAVCLWCPCAPTEYAAFIGTSQVNSAGYVLGLLTMIVSVTMESQLSGANRNRSSYTESLAHNPRHVM